MFFIECNILHSCTFIECNIIYPSRLLGTKKLSVIGGHLDSRCDVAGVREGGALELRVMLLTRCGKVLFLPPFEIYQNILL